MKIPVRVTEREGIARTQEPVELGFPIPRGEISPEYHWVVLDEAGRPLLSQFKTLATHADGSLRGIHGIFLLELKPNQTRTLTIAAGKEVSHDILLDEKDGFFQFNTGKMRGSFNSWGELSSLLYQETELLDQSAATSLQLQVALGPAGSNLSDSAERLYIPKELRELKTTTGSVSDLFKGPAFTAKIKESGPVRAILNVSGKLILGDRRGPMEIVVDCDYVIYAGRSEIHMRPMLLGAVTEATVLNDWSLLLHLKNGGSLTYGRSRPLVREDPNHENMTWRGLKEGWVSWQLENNVRFTFWSPDFIRHQNGFVNTQVLDRERKRLAVKVGRIEPYWGYQDVNNPPKPITIFRGSWRRWEGVFAFSPEQGSPRRISRSCRSPLRAYPSTDYYRKALAPWLEGVSRPSALRTKVIEKCDEFVCKEPEYVGSLHGGWDGPNNTYIERSVLRGEFGEYLFHEFFRTKDQHFYRIAFDFGQVYRDLFCFTIETASDGPHELGAARSRQIEYLVCPIRSYRGAVLLAYMYQETGDERYLDAFRKRAAFHLVTYPHHHGRLSASTRDTAYMGDYLHDSGLIEKAVEVTLHSLNKHFDPENGFWEEYDESRTLPDGRHPPLEFPQGRWFMKDFLHTSNASPEMMAYNVIGWYGLSKLHHLESETMDKIRKVCEWFRDHQNKDGSWPYPHVTSVTKWGHGCLQDSLAMLYAYKLFGEPSFLGSARKSINFAKRTFKKFSRIPLLLGLLPHQETEDSLTYYYGIETLAVYHEIVGSVRGR